MGDVVDVEAGELLRVFVDCDSLGIVVSPDGSAPLRARGARRGVSSASIQRSLRR